MNEKPEKPLQFETRAKLQEKQAMRIEIENAITALTLAVQGKGGEKVPTKNDFEILGTLKNEFEELHSDIMRGPLSYEQKREIFDRIGILKMGLHEYLSPEQIEGAFHEGTFQFPYAHE